MIARNNIFWVYQSKDINNNYTAYTGTYVAAFDPLRAKEMYHAFYKSACPLSQIHAVCVRRDATIHAGVLRLGDPQAEQILAQTGLTYESNA